MKADSATKEGAAMSDEEMATERWENEGGRIAASAIAH
jgi:hypothetical protein